MPSTHVTALADTHTQRTEQNLVEQQTTTTQRRWTTTNQPTTTKQRTTDSKHHNHSMVLVPTFSSASTTNDEQCITLLYRQSCRIASKQGREVRSQLTITVTVTVTVHSRSRSHPQQVSEWVNFQPSAFIKNSLNEQCSLRRSVH